MIQELLREAGHQTVASGTVFVSGTGVEEAADMKDVESPETYIGTDHAENFASPGGAVQDQAHHYKAPATLALTNGRSRVTGVLADKTPSRATQRRNNLPLPCAGSASGPGACSRRQAGEVAGPDRWGMPRALITVSMSMPTAMGSSRDSGYISWCVSRAMSRTTRSRLVSSVPARPPIHLCSVKPNPAPATSFAGCRWPLAVRPPRWSSQRHIAAPTIDGGPLVIPIRSEPRQDNCIDGWHYRAWLSKIRDRSE